MLYVCVYVIISIGRIINCYLQHGSIKAVEGETGNLIGEFLLKEVVSSAITVEIRAMIE